MYFVYNPQDNSWNTFSTTTEVETFVSVEVPNSFRANVEVYHGSKVEVDFQVQANIKWGG